MAGRIDCQAAGKTGVDYFCGGGDCHLRSLGCGYADFQVSWQETRAAGRKDYSSGNADREERGAGEDRAGRERRPDYHPISFGAAGKGSAGISDGGRGSAKLHAEPGGSGFRRVDCNQYRFWAGRRKCFRRRSWTGTFGRLCIAGKRGCGAGSFYG